MSRNGRTGEELHRRERKPSDSKRPTIRTQRTALQSALLRHLPPGILQLSKKLLKMSDRGEEGVDLYFTDGSSARADLVVGADGIRSVVRDTAWTDYNLAFTGTTIWRTLLEARDVADLDPRFQTTGWWHAPTTHVYFSPVGEGLWEIACRAYHDPETHRADKVSWGVPVANAAVEAHFGDLLPDIRTALGRVPAGGWREFAAFAGPELATLVAWDGRVALVGDASHALSGAFGAGAGFAMEDGWLLAQALRHFRNHRSRALAAFDDLRVPYYSRMYSYLAKQGAARTARLQALGNPSYDDRVRAKIITDGGEDMSWIYQHDIAAAWSEAINEAETEDGRREDMKTA